MAAEPIPMPESSNKVSIASDGTVTGQVNVNNGGVVKFEVTSYKPGYNACIVTITSANITWEAVPDEGQNTIKVGN